MGLLKKTVTNSNFWPLVIVLLLGILASRTLIFQSGYFNMHDDLQMMRQLMMEKCFLDGQIPCRWVPDMGYGFGAPLFNFYPPLPYLVGQILRWVGFTFVTTVKLTFSLSIILSGITMYYLAKEFFGRWGGLLSSAFYIWAPYHAVDVYVRGAMNEAWSLVWFPLILWSSYKLIVSNREFVGRWVIILGMSFAMLMLSHNLMVLIFTPVLAVWVLLHLFLSKSWKRVPVLVVSGLLAFGLSAFFTLPAMLENKYTHIKSALVGYYDYSVHFVTIRQLLTSRFWGYGPSVWLDIDDRMSFQAGHLHWTLSILVSLIISMLVIGYIKKPKLFKKVFSLEVFLVTGMMVAFGWLAAFLTHSRSTPIWIIVSPLAYMQFPWRFLTIVIFAFSFTVGFLPYILGKLSKQRSQVVRILSFPIRFTLLISMIVVVVSFSWNYFLPEYEKMGPLTDEEKFSDVAWDKQQTAGIYDYLPSTAITAPKAPMSELVEVMEGEVVVNTDSQGTDWMKADIVVEGEGAIVRLGITKFPGWITYIDGVEVDNYIGADEEWGRIYIAIPAGEHELRAEFRDTPVRTLANVITVVAMLGLAGYFISRRWMKRK